MAFQGRRDEPAMGDEFEATKGYSAWQMNALVFTTGLCLFNFTSTASNIGAVLLYIDRAHTDCSQEAICLESSMAKGLLVSSCLVGASVGAFFSGTVAVHCGVRRVILWNNLFFVLGALCSALAPGLWPLILARCISGIGAGTASALAHVYIGSVVSPKRRGEYGAILVMMGTAGILVANLVCWALAARWRWSLASGALPALLQVALGPMMPEPKAASKPFSEDSESEDCLEEASGPFLRLWQAVKSGEAISPVVIGCGLHILAQFSGINVTPGLLFQSSFSIALGSLWQFYDVLR